MFARELHNAGHVKRFFIDAKDDRGWEVREEQDSQVLRRVCYTDWHRVERALQVFRMEIGRLEDHGWSS